MASSKIDNHDLDEQVKKQFYEHSEIPMIIATDETCSELDTIGNSLPNSTYYRRHVYHEVSHPIIGGGNKYLEGFKSTDKFEWQICTTYTKDGGFSWGRAKFEGVWTEWSTIYLPLTGGTLSGSMIKLSDGKGAIEHASNMTFLVTYDEANKSDNYRYLAVSNSIPAVLKYAVMLVDRVNNTQTKYYLFGEHNKPSGSYTGNGSARTIDVGGIGKVLRIVGNGCYALVTHNGAFVSNGSTVTAEKELTCNDDTGKLEIPASSKLNTSGKLYYYQLL